MGELSQIIFKQHHHEIPVFEHIDGFIRVCHQGQPAALYAPDMPAEVMHSEVARRLVRRPILSKEAPTYTGPCKILPSPDGGSNLHAEDPLRRENGHTEGSLEKEWLQDFVISYFGDDSHVEDGLELSSAADVLNTLSGSETQLLLNMTVEIKKTDSECGSRYVGPLLRMESRTWAFRWRFDSVAQIRCTDSDPIMRSDADQLLCHLATRIAALPKTVVQPHPGLIIYVTQAGALDNCLIHRRAAGSTSQGQMARRQWLNRLG